MATKVRGLPPFYYRPDLNEIELSSDPSPLRPTERTEKKADPTAGAIYTSKLTQAAYPIPGTAPAEVAAAKKIINESGPVKYDKNGLPNKATPEQMGAAAERLERMHQMEGKPDKPKNKKINPYSKVKIPIPTIINHSLLRKSVADKNKAAALEKLRVFAFTPRPNDVVKGIGSLMKTIAVKPEEEI